MNPRDTEFFLGRVFNLKTKQVIADKHVYYDPSDLTTHAVITGMTGSGKTGLGIILLEEAALQGIPAILIDPKGDLTNHLLHFPELLPADFAPWIDEDAARRDGNSIERAAEDAASSWKKGLADWGIDKPRLEALSENVDYAVYTPGSDSGISVSILASLKCPEIPWEGNKEVLRERISSTVTALLGLVGLKDIDPVRSREHILLANIFESAWSQGADLDLEKLILQAQNPPFEKLGVFTLAKFYPEKERFELAMLLNNFLAAPAFQTWLEGQALDIALILYTPEGKPRHSVFYLAHLADAERMFFVTLLYSAIETWMRTQSGSSGLRALVYFDEIVGFLPPVSNPPSKPIILRLLKQARAFGIGLVLATQNPIDLDYKALSNAGTWMIGKLQTDQDKQRLLDGLEGVSSGLNRSYFDKTISELGKRVFLLHNVHEKAPVVFSTRWAMNYLPGPITRNKLSALNALVGADKISQKTAQRSTSDGTTSRADVGAKGFGTATQPVLASSVEVYYLPINRGPSEALADVKDQLPEKLPTPQYFYKAALIGQARVYYADRKYKIDHEEVYTTRIEKLKKSGLVRWEDYLVEHVKTDTLSNQALSNARFGELSPPLDNETSIKDMSEDFVDWIYRTRHLKLQFNEILKLNSEPSETTATFRERCSKAAREALDDESDKIKAKYDKKMDSLELKLKREKLELDKDQKELSQRRLEEAGKGIENVLKLLGSRKTSLSTSLTKRRMTTQAKADVEESEQMIAMYEKQLAEIENDFMAELEEAKKKIADSVNNIKEIYIGPLRKNIFVELFGVVWMPYYAFKVKGEWATVEAFK
ncbi:MAG: DUF87 domain-containing protein [Chloroflexota bacterium]